MDPKNNPFTRIVLLTSSVIALPTVSHAAGFALIEQSASGLGTSFAGSAAEANDSSILFFNPAGLTELASPQFVLAGHGIDIQADFTDRGSRLPLAGAGQLPTGATSSEGGDLVAVPNFYFSLPLNDKLFFGVGVNAPFGLKTEYDDPWIGRFQGTKSELTTINVNPTLAYRLTENFSLGVGANWQRADAELGNAVILAPGVEGRALLDVDDDAWGWNVGALWKLPSDTKIGLGYRSKIEYTLEGGTTVTTMAGTVIPTASGATNADITMPDMAYLSVSQGLNEKVRLLADVSWTNWSEVHEISAFNSETGVARDFLRFELEDAWRVALGFNWDYNETWTFRSGIAWDETPVQDEFRTVRLPDGDRTWLSVGARWKPTEQLAVDAGYAHLFVDDTTVDLTRAQVGASALASSTVIGDYENAVDIFSLQLTYALR